MKSYIFGYAPAYLFVTLASIISLSLAQSLFAQTVPLVLKATQSCVSGAPQISLTWNNPNNATSIKLHRNPTTAGAVSWKLLASGAGTFLSHTDAAVNAGTTYKYQVQTTNNSGSSRYSDVQTINITPCITTPPPVVSTQPQLTGTASCVAGAPQVALSWTNTTNATSFTMHRNPSVSGSAVWRSLAVGLTQSSFNDTKVSAGTYQYQIEALGGTPAQRYSTIRSIVVPNCTVVVPPATTTPPAATTTTPSKRLKWGAYSGWEDVRIQEFETKVGGTPDHIAAFVHWGNNNAFPTYMNKYAKDKNRTLVIFWEPSDHVVGGTVQPNFSQDAILAGNWDAYIRKFADEARAYGGPVILIPFSEMNGNWNPWSGTTNGNTPAKVVAGYRHVRTVFGNVPNVQFGWAPNANSVPDTTANAIANYYPGDAYVDIVGVDGFNRGTPWQTFDQVFSKPLALLATYNKPIYIFSFASEAGTGKAAWITDALTVAMKKYQLIDGWVWFNQHKEHNWLIWSDDASLTAFKNAIK